MNLTAALIAGAVTLYVLLRVGTSFLAKGGGSKKAQQWILGDRANGKSPHRDHIVM
jgi:hypothetical protein